MRASSVEMHARMRACARGLCVLTLWGVVTVTVAEVAVPPFT